MQIRQADKHMQTSLWGIAQKAAKDPNHRFGNLFSLLNEENLRWCFHQLNKKAAPGVDKVDYATYAGNLDENNSQIARDLKEGKYKAKFIRRHYIPKAGGRRPLGIPVVGDKVAQMAVALILSAIYEADFLPFSHGYRRGRGPQQAALELSQKLHRGKIGWILDADIKGFFDNLDHSWLIKMLSHRINDRRFLGLVLKWLKAGIIEEDGRLIHPITGTPQGGVVSAVLANIYLHYALDLWFEKVVKPRCRGQVMMMRFADDFVCCFQYHEDATRFYAVLGKRLLKFNLELSQDKTRLVKFTRFTLEKGQSFTFLGFDYRWQKSRSGKPLVTMVTSKKKFRKSLAAVTEWIRKVRCRLGTARIMRTLGAKLRGYWNYYGVCGNYEMLSQYYQQVIRIVFKWLNRRSQRKSCTWAVFRTMREYYQIPRPRIVGYWE